jgi:hypothetical protein
VSKFQEDRFLGEFRELSHGSPDGPSLALSMRSAGDADEPKITQYLSSGAVLAATGSSVFDALQPEVEIGQLLLLTDGYWCWYSDLPYYVSKYHVELKSQFLSDGRARDWVFPRVSVDDLSRLEEEMFT